MNDIAGWSNGYDPRLIFLECGFESRSRSHILTALLLAVFLSGCSVPPIVPIIGKPHVGNVTNNVYHAAVEQVEGYWKFYLWIVFLVLGCVLTPIGGILVSKLRKYKAAFLQTASAVKHHGSKRLEEELSSRQTDRTKGLVRKMKAKGEI